MRIKLVYLLCFFVTSVSAQLPIPSNGIADSKNEYVLIRNATILVSPDVSYKNASILLQGDRIVEVGKFILKPKSCLEIDGEGKTLVPAFIELNSSYGIAPFEVKKSESPQLESTKSTGHYWNESIHPEWNAFSHYTFDPKASENFLKMGFGFSLSSSQDGVSMGSASLYALNKIAEKGSLIRQEASAHFAFRKGASQQSYPSSEMGCIALLRQALYDAKAYAKMSQKSENLALEALNKQLAFPLLFHASDQLQIPRAQKIAEEFGLKFVFLGAGNEYENVQLFADKKLACVLPLNFPKAYAIQDPYVAKNITLSELKHWELAPSNPVLLRNANIPIALSSAGIEKPEDFWNNLRTAISRGLSPNDALNALTLQAATFIGMEKEIGSLEKGKYASFSIYDGNPFEENAKLLEVWSLGERNSIQAEEKGEIRGTYNAILGTESWQLIIQGTAEKLEAKALIVSQKIDPISKRLVNDTLISPCFIQLVDKDLSIQFASKAPDFNGNTSLHAKVNYKLGVLEGDATNYKGEWVKWSAVLANRDFPKDKSKAILKDSLPLGHAWFPNMAFGWDKAPQAKSILIENATLWTNEADGILTNASLWIENGKIKQISKGSISVPAGTLKIDANGKHLTSGIIDEHSHIAISNGVNESGQSITAEVSIGTVVNPKDINVYRQLSGGVTTAHLLHGSANAIGGQSAIIKLKWGYSAEEMLLKNAPKFIKFALGENVKQANWGEKQTVRFPQTRMGVEQVFYDGFERAKAYQEAKNNWKNAIEKQRERKELNEPAVDLELETLVEILNGERHITCHSYIQSEINMLMHVADSMGFKINTFTHILEGYKVADKMKAHGAGASTFADWWAYKFEVLDAIPYNAAMMTNLGIVTAINSDDAEMGRRLNQEAAKTIKYGGMTEEEAWKMVTLNPAKLLHLDDRLGSLKVGKDADLVLWSTNPLQIDALVEKTIIDGEILYDRSQNDDLNARNQREKARLISKMLLASSNGAETQVFKKKKKRHFHCNTIGFEGSEGVNEH